MPIYGITKHKTLAEQLAKLCACITLMTLLATKKTFHYQTRKIASNEISIQVPQKVDATTVNLLLL